MRRAAQGFAGTIATAAVVAACLASPAMAATVVEDFETPGYGAGTTISTQFQPSTGIRFTASPGANITLPKIATDVSRSSSRSLDITTAPGEFPKPGLEGRFDTVVTDVTVHTRNLFTTAGRMKLVAFHATGSKESGWVNVAPGSWVAISVPVADAGKSYSRFQLLSEGGTNDGKEFRVDDISFETDPAAAADYNIHTEDPGGLVLAGVPKTFTIDVQRLNGFSGAVSFSGTTTAWGGGVSFSPSTTTGSTTTATLTVPSGAPESAAETVTFNATGTPGARSLELPIRVEKPFVLDPAPTVVEAHRCTTTTFDVRVVRNGAYPDPIDMQIRPLVGAEIPSDLNVSITPERFDDPSRVVNTATVRITRGDDPDLAERVVLRVRAASAHLTRTSNFDIQRAAPRLTAAGPATVLTPQSLFGGTAASVTGNGICPGAQLQFGNDRARVPATLTPAPTAAHPGQVRLAATTPRLATTGQIAAVNPSGAVATGAGVVPDTTVATYRNRFGFSFPNEKGTPDEGDPPAVGAGSLRDWQELLGPQQTNLNACEVGAIFPFCWEVLTPIPSPAHGIMQTILGEAALYNRGGTCVGFAIASRRIAANQVVVNARPAGGLAAPVWSLQRTGREWIPGRGDIPAAGRQSLSPIKYAAIQHAGQMTAEYLELWMRRRTTNAIEGPGRMKAAIQRDLRDGYRPLLNINWDGAGHAVNVYDIEDTPDGGFILHIYDNNYPFLPSENTDAPGHEWGESAMSRIVVSRRGGWTAEGLRVVTARDAEGRVTASVPRSGPTGDLSWVTVERELPRYPTSLATLDGLRVLATPQLGATLQGGESAAESRRTGLLEMGYLDGKGSMLAADASKAHTIPVAANTRGRTDVGVFGEGTVARVRASGSSSRGARAAATPRDRIILPKGGSESIGFRATGSRARVGLDLVSEKAGRMVSVTGARRGTTRVRLVGRDDRVEVTSSGSRGTVQLELTSFADRSRSTRFRTSLRLGKGDKLTLSPHWKRLGGRLTARVNGRRRVLRNRAKAPVKVRSVRLSAERRSKVMRTTTRGSLRGRRSGLTALVLNVEIRKGKTLVARRTRMLGNGSTASRRLAKGHRLDITMSSKKMKAKGRYTVQARVTASGGKPVPIGHTKSARRRVR